MASDVTGIWEFSDLLHNDDGKRTKTTPAKVTRVDNSGTVWVALPGGVEETPINGMSTSAVAPGDTVQVDIENGRANLVGNATSPAVGEREFEGAVEPLRQSVETQNARLSVLDDRIETEVRAIDGMQEKVTEIEQTADAISATISSVGLNLLGDVVNPVLSDTAQTEANDVWWMASGGDGVGSIETVTDSPQAGCDTVFRISDNTSGNRDFAQVVSDADRTVTKVSELTDYVFSTWVRGIGGDVTYLVRMWDNQLIYTMQGAATTSWQRISFVVRSSRAYNAGNKIQFQFGISGAGDIEYLAPTLQPCGASDTSTMVRAYEDGVLVCRTGETTGALVNADGSFDVVTVSWSGGVPSVTGTVSTFTGTAVSLLNGAFSLLTLFGAMPVVQYDSNGIVLASSYTTPSGVLKINTGIAINDPNSTTGSIGIYTSKLRVNSQDYPMVIETGSRGQDTNVGANTYKDFNITFSKTFSAAPTVIVGLASTSTASSFGRINVAVKADSVTKTGFTVRIFNDDSSTRSPGFRWAAIGN